MSDQAQRQFSVHALQGRHNLRVLDETSFEAAAIAFVEDWPAQGDDIDIVVNVRELRTGREHCFRIDLDTGEAAPCG